VEQEVGDQFLVLAVDKDGEVERHRLGVADLLWREED
jgi:hypothetical protein